MLIKKIIIDAICDVGAVRKNNEDMVSLDGLIFRDNGFQLTLEPNEFDINILIAVSDGMGGHNAGEIASEIVLTDLHKVKEELPPDVSDDVDSLKTIFENALKETHQKLLDEGKRDSSKLGMGATLIAVLFLDNKAFYLSAGDSRLYRYRRGMLKQLSRDHSLAELLGDERSSSHIILNSVGGGETVFIDFIEITKSLIDDDVLLLCSDGLTDVLTDEEIETTLTANLNAVELCNKTKATSGKDNISIVLLKLNGESED